MKPTVLLVSLVFLLGITGGCGKKKAVLNPAAMKDIAVLTTTSGITDLTADQARELKNTMDWMDRDLIDDLSGSGFNVVLIKEMPSYRSEMGKLLIVDVERFNAGNRAARAFVGFGAGAASLDIRYRLLDEKGALVTEWRDGVGSSKGPTYCAETLNRKTLAKLFGLINT